jgi:transketolase
VDGRSVEEIYQAIEEGKRQSEQPVAIIMDTVKGQGVPYLEEKADNHHIRPSKEDEEAIVCAIAELENKLGKVVS